MEMDRELYRYKATVTEVYDGDTCTVDIDLGLRTWIRDEKVRLYGINAPELRGAERPAGLISRDFLREQILGKEVFLHTIKDKKGKYGRYLAQIWIKSQEGEWVNINDQMVHNEFAEYKEY